MRRYILPTTVVTLGLSSTSLGWASLLYPSTLAQELGTEPPLCTVCHDELTGGMNTANKPFAVTLLGFGLTGMGRTSTLREGLMTAETAESDSDADGVPDIEELRRGRDPNEADTRGSPDASQENGDDDGDAAAALGKTDAGQGPDGRASTDAGSDRSDAVSLRHPKETRKSDSCGLIHGSTDRQFPIHVLALAGAALLARLRWRGRRGGLPGRQFRSDSA